MSQADEPESLVSARKPSQLPTEPPPTVMAALRDRLSGREQQIIGTVFVVRKTAQQLDNAVSESMANTTASPARFQILALLWAAKKRAVPHKEIVAALGVTRATVSGLMAGLERDGLVASAVASGDRRSVLASLTRKGEAMIEKAIESTSTRLRTAFDAMSQEELTTLTALLERIRQGFTVGSEGAGRQKA
jgi:DNA-binding MarR family transcriptional regulator